MDIHEAFAWYDRAIDNAIDYLNLDREEQDKAWNVIDKFIDEAIARQSATSEEVQEAIGLLSGKSYGTHNLSCDCVFCKAIDLAITALQAYQPTISKTETTTCEWCDSGIDAASVMSADMMMRFVRPVNYCPNCGRRLEE